MHLNSQFWASSVAAEWPDLLSSSSAHWENETVQVSQHQHTSKLLHVFILPKVLRKTVDTRNFIFQNSQDGNLYLRFLFWFLNLFLLFYHTNEHFYFCFWVLLACKNCNCKSCHWDINNSEDKLLGHWNRS